MIRKRSYFFCQVGSRGRRGRRGTDLVISIFQPIRERTRIRIPRVPLVPRSDHATNKMEWCASGALRPLPCSGSQRQCADTHLSDDFNFSGRKSVWRAANYSEYDSYHWAYSGVLRVQRVLDVTSRQVGKPPCRLDPEQIPGANQTLTPDTNNNPYPVRWDRAMRFKKQSWDGQKIGKRDNRNV